MADAFADAERLVREAQRAAQEAARSAPPRGWAAREGQATTGPAFPDLAGLAALVEGLRGALPPDLARQLADAVHDLLVAVRAILDLSIARLERPPAESVQVEDIPID